MVPACARPAVSVLFRHLVIFDLIEPIIRVVAGNNFFLSLTLVIIDAFAGA
jgi:hypothetical protein